MGNDRNVLTPLRSNGRPYRGINILLLWDAAIEKGHRCSIWMTYKQALELNANVRKREKGTRVVYANKATKLETDEHGAEI